MWVNVLLQYLLPSPPLPITFYPTCITRLTLSMDLFPSAYKEVHWETKTNKQTNTLSLFTVLSPALLLLLNFLVRFITIKISFTDHQVHFKTLTLLHNIIPLFWNLLESHLWPSNGFLCSPFSLWLIFKFLDSFESNFLVSGFYDTIEIFF